MESFRGRFAAFVVVASLFGAGSAQAQVVISQVYGGGGNSGATYKNDFIELRNNGSSPVDLGGWSVQYASSTGSSWQRTNLAGTIAPGGYYLIQQAQGSGGTTDLPAPDASGTIPMSGTNGKVALSTSTTALSGTCPLGAGVVDFVGFGSSANCFEGTAPTATLSNTTAALRKGDGSIDSNDNAADFATGAPNPRNSGSEPPDPPEPAVELGIAQIQGSGLVSPYANQLVATEGVVTALKYNNGFFLQSLQDDGKPATSDGIFVFTGSAPTLAVGSRVKVTATVSEYVPSTNPNQLTITELTDPVIELLATGVALPAPIAIAASDLAPDALPGTLEKLEGMRVSLAQAVVVAPSGGSIDENDALAFSDGVFHVTLPGVARPFREEGIGVLDAIAIPAGKDPPRFDTNPERLMVRSRGQVNALPISVDTGAEVDGLIGVLDYYAGTWALLPDVATPPTVSGGLLPSAVNDPDYDEITVGGFNLLRLFDDVNDSNGAVTLTPVALDKRLNKAALAICNYLKAPDILGVVEVENLNVLALLSQRIDATCATPPGYVPYLQPGNDVGGINVGFLVSGRATADGLARVEVVDVAQFGKQTTLANPDGSSSLLNDRPPLRLRARVRQDGGSSYPLTVIVNHLRSLNGIDDGTPGSNGWPTGGERVRAKRGAQAAYLAGLVNQMQQADPAEKIVLVGDFNAFQFNDGYVDVMGVVKGEPAPADQVLTWVDSPLATPLVDGSEFIADPAQRYSYVFEGNAQTLDHVLVNEALVMDTDLRVDHPRINADFGVDNFGDDSIGIRSSDHDPVRVSIRVPAFARADLSVAATADRSEVLVGEAVHYEVQVANAGPGMATPTAVAFVFNALLVPALDAVPAGWNCAAAEQQADTTTVTCTTPSLAVGGTAAFGLTAIAPLDRAGELLGLGVSAHSPVTDPANADNTTAVSVAVLAPGSADLAVSLPGSSRTLPRGKVSRLNLMVDNDGPDAALRTRLWVEGNLPPQQASLVTPRDWSCDEAQATATGFAIACTPASDWQPGQDKLVLLVDIPANASQPALEWSARLQAATPDPRPGNNQAQATSRIH